MVLMEIAAVMSEDQIGGEFFFQLLEIFLDLQSLIREKTCSEISYLNRLLFRQF